MKSAILYLSFYIITVKSVILYLSFYNVQFAYIKHPNTRHCNTKSDVRVYQDLPIIYISLCAIVGEYEPNHYVQPILTLLCRTYIYIYIYIYINVNLLCLGQ